MFVVYYASRGKPEFTQISVNDWLVIYHPMIVPYESVWAIPGTLED
jgi:hypothetical protein